MNVQNEIASKVLESYFDCWVEEGQPNPTCGYTRAIFQGLMNCSSIVQEALGMQEELVLPCYNGGSEGGDDGEYLCDFTLTTTYYRTRRESAYHAHPSRRCGVLLAAESELSAKHVDDVFLDFWKLTDIKAPHKVMVYAYRKNRLSAIRYGFEKILTDHFMKDMTEKWVFLGLPWPGEWNEYAMDTLAWNDNCARLVAGTVDERWN